MNCPACNTKINPAAMLGSIRSPKKARAARRNGKMGGRPKTVKPSINTPNTHV
jgi:hypothetical protein